MNPFYVTTPIYYINAEPHLGHFYTTMIADVLSRFHRQRGEATYFITGTDEHGDKIADAAAAAGLSPHEHADRVSRIFQDTWVACGFSHDAFIRTTHPAHIALVQEALAQLHAADDIYFGSYTGLYCVGCERLYTEKELVAGKCPDHLTAPTPVSEENYFFRMSQYQARWLAELEARPDLIMPESYRNEVLSLLRSETLGDLCISRPKSRLTWGIELPFDCNYVTYVWFDALLSYISVLKIHGTETYQRFWPAVHHLIAKDILKPHGIFWPTMLMALGVPRYQQLRVHGYWTRGESKMSKSLGNVIRPLDMKARYGLDSFRYFLLREMAFGQDASFNEDAFVTRVNADLANNLGNLVSRTLAMQQRYFDGVVQPLGPRTPEDQALIDAFATAAGEAEAFTERFQFHRALESLWRAIDHANKYVVTTAPFTLAKTTAERPRVGAILHHLLEVLYSTAALLTPFLPETSARIFDLLQVPAATVPGIWGTQLADGHQTAKPLVLFPRIEPTAT